ncbi:hypothetical protein SH580_01055 [Coraliomargarita algicola]|uniref:Uncharacterized protein n=1 Tax=Coraliomargarita algicola TaxID=3092156 RepID=A0ABZ0RTJ2_9BACT|nr:hypothetical protein [Coraliomargarita sp. J2-16]WPJ96289.1 hypothetical protein SH580_01055 [Coraliomargarita sp. J2-16]
MISLRLVSGVCALAFASTLSASSAYAHLNAKEDGGSAVYSDGTPDAPMGSLASAEQAAAYPLMQQARIYVIGGSVRGAGMLAELQPDSDGKLSVLIARRTSLSNRDKEPYTPIALARLIAPDGTLAAHFEFTDQNSETSVAELSVENAQAGVWRLSFSGGRSNDIIEFRLPQTDIWGVRGEMSLGTTPRTPGVTGNAYLWAPPSAFLMMVGIDKGNTSSIKLSDRSGQTTLAEIEPDAAKRAGRLIPRPTPQGEVVQLTLGNDFDGVLTVEGVPGLLCPTPEAAERLKGGMVKSYGKWVGGPLQARARELAIQTAASIDRDLSFQFPQEIPDDLDNLGVHVLGFSKYGALNSIAYKVRQQNKYLDDIMDLNFGSTRRSPKAAPTSEDDFRPLGVAAIFDPAAFAGAITFDSPLNPAYQSQELTKRATLGATVNISNLQGDDLMREGSLLKSVYPITHAFFAFPSAFADPFLELQSYLDPETREIWRQGVMAAGDKLADFQAYQSNQWSHMMLAHLNTYLATGEERFLGYFERQARAYYGNTYGPSSKFGIHPSGYYLEDYGPDGNYDKLNSFCVATAYYTYRELANADPELVALIKNAIQRNLRFTSFFWLPQPDGGIFGPNHMNARKSAYLGGIGYPGDIMTKSEFPFSAARFALTKNPTRGIGGAGTFSFIANRDDWIRATIEDGLKKGADGYESGSGTWVANLVKCFSIPKIVEPAELPYEADGKTWTLPGMLTWNQNGIYGMVFSDVAGTKLKRHKSITGGAPSALWTAGTGTFLNSVISTENPTARNFAKPEELTFASIYGTTASGDFFHSGRERAKRESNDSNKVHTITSELESPRGTITWKYDYSQSPLRIGVSFKTDQTIEECYVNLPFSTRLADATIKLMAPSTAVFTTDTGRVKIDWQSTHAGKVSPSVKKATQRLTVPISTDGAWTWFEFEPVTFNEMAQNH